jgi:hypothetical protein
VLVRLELPFVDARAADLTLALGAAPEEGLGSIKLAAAGGAEAELRLLGCSHQALVRSEDYELSELVACRPGPTASLPSRADHVLGDRRYEFRANVTRMASNRYAGTAAALTQRVAAREDGLVGVFPGREGAFTALQLSWHESELRWETWHGYPQSGELVYTASRIGS